MVRYDSLRAFLAMTAQKDLELLQFDVQTAFLYGDLDEDIFMEVPEGVDVKGNPEEGIAREDVVCKLNKSLYGLKQAPRCWNHKFTQFLNQFNFKSSEADQCIFVGKVKNVSVYLALFVDDGLVATKEALNIVVKRLKETFKIKIGDLNIFVGLQIERDRIRKSLAIHQSLYINKILDRFKLNNIKTVSVPADPHTILYPVKEDDKSISVPYREAVGSLVFLASISRPDIAFAVNIVSKFVNNYNQEHWQAVKRIFAYLKGTVDYKIQYISCGEECELTGFSDADFANDVETRRSITGYIFFLAGGPITWSSKRQKLVTLSTTESEYVAASAAAKETIWLKKLLRDLEYPCKEMILYVDNQSTIKLTHNPEYHKRTKHIDIQYHYIREKVTNKDIKIGYVPSEIQKADILTKALPRDRFKKLCDIIKISSLD